MDDAKKQIVDIIRNNGNILVTVSTDPSVDELSAALGLTVLLNNMDKRATAVFSGSIPPAINFLEPDKTFENTADSLRDFIIALDKEKADHLRYKVEGDVVKIFITPYKTTLTQDDLEFSQGDYNVEVVLALGVTDQDHLDKALEAHGKILHDANVLTITAGADTSNLGALDWHDAGASSLSEMIVSLIDGLKEEKPLLDEQISTALLTGIVSATDRFSNNNTSSRAMTVAAQLMAAGANQQLIAAKLEEAHDIAPGPVIGSESKPVEPEKKSDGTELTIERSDRKPAPEQKEKVIEPLAEQVVAPIADVAPVVETSEESNQKELEQHLAGLASPTTGSMADIEKELHDAAEQPAPAAVIEEPIPEPEQVPTPAPVEAAEPILAPVPEPLPALPPIPAPEIVNDHSSPFGDNPTEPLPPINSIQNSPNDGEPTVDPFTPPLQPLEVSPLAPAMNADPGTQEGAELLASDPDAAMLPTLEPLAPEPAGIPQLPPLPPLPPDPSQTPLPPPPPLPPGFGSPLPSNQSGAIPGDVFGDGNAPVQQTDQTPPPAEPGQFRIPGQG